jgi:hypothetical protein
MSNTSSPVKRALLIGIDQYPKLTQLEGCVNDVQLMRSILQESFGFSPENVTLLADAEATREGILAALDQLVEATGTGDIAVIHYAGHGSQMTDREGDEPDGLDETIMPYDSEGRWGVNRDITDDEIHLRLVRLGAKTPYTTLIFDSCHSGTITRDAFGVRSRSVEPDTRPVSELPPSPIPPEERAALRAGESGPSGWMPLTDRYVLIAGCRDEETSFEYRPPEGDGKIVHGAMTYFLSEELRRAAPGTSYRDVFERVASKVNAANGNQHPQMEGRPDRELFGVKNLDVMTFVPITGRDGGAVTLGRGAAQGMTKGSIWSVYPQGTRRAAGATPLGRVELTAVRAVASDARVVEEPVAGAIVVGGYAVETVHAYGDLRIKVQVVGPPGQEAYLAGLRQALQQSELLELVDEHSTASARAYLVAARARAGEQDPVPQLGAVAAPVWAVVTENGQLMMPPKPLDAVADVKTNLEKLARYRQALALENPDPASAMRGAFELDLMRLGPNGRWVVAEPEAAGGQIVFEEGEAIAFRITSRHGEAVFVNLLDFGLTGSVGLVFPARGAKEKLGARMNFEIGTRPGQRGFTLKMPKEFPYADNPQSGPAEGLETLKLFVTAGDADFSFLSQQGVRSAGGPESPLMRLWRTAMTPTVRDIEPSLPVGDEDWTTVTKSFLLRRRSAAALSSDGQPVQVGDATLRTPGLSGEATAHGWRSPRAEAAALSSDELTKALDGAGVEVRQTVEIGGVQPAGPVSRGGGPATGNGAPKDMELQVRDPGPGFGQMVMTTDELGAVSWHFAPEAEARPASRGAEGGLSSAVRVYRIPGAVPVAAPQAPASRGLVGAVGKKFLKVLVFPLIEPGIGAVSDSFALRWEAKRRPYRIRRFGPDDYAAETAAEITGEDWRRLGAGRALLMVHGTFSRAHAAFGGLPKEFVEALHRSYGGRVFAFDHFTLSHDPRQNVNWLIDRLPDGTALDLDIICHSRGGLVSRLLAEKQSELVLGGRRIRVGKIVFVGSPNAGTILADASHMGDLIDTYTNLLNFLPDTGVTEVLDGVIAVAKQLAVGAAKGLPGLQSMRPGGDFAKWLNAGPRGDTRYFALASNFTPSEPGLRRLALDRLMDRVFKTGNDLVVPTEGVFADNGSKYFPIEQRFVFQGSDGVAHTGFFAHRGARDKIMEWLSA